MGRNVHSYGIEVLSEQGWVKLDGIGDATKSFCKGFAWGHYGSPPPRLAIRVVRSDGKVILEHSGDSEVSVGMIVGWPTAEQYEGAAERAIEKAVIIRDHKRRMRERKGE